MKLNDVNCFVLIVFFHFVPLQIRSFYCLISFLNIVICIFFARDRCCCNYPIFILFYSKVRKHDCLDWLRVNAGCDASTHRLVASQQTDGTFQGCKARNTLFFLLWWCNSHTRNDCGGRTKSHLETGQPWNCFTFSPTSEFFFFSFYIHIYWLDRFWCFERMWFRTFIFI